MTGVHGMARNNAIWQGAEADSQEQWTAHALLRVAFLKGNCCAAPPGLHYYSGLTQPYGFACARLRLG
jgi:hypothetical protein